MTKELDVNNSDLLEIQFTITDEHQKIISDIYELKNVIAEKPLLINFQIIPKWMYDAFVYVYKIANESKNFSIADICAVHRFLGLVGEFRTPKQDSTCVRFGTDYPYFPPDAEEVPALMKKYEYKYSLLENYIEPLQRICETYFLFELIHPFEDGNGRTGRLICAWTMF
jgi:hypothetical protein